MSRAPFQVLVLPFRRLESGAIEYALLRRRDAGYWQFVAGGGEEGESPLEAARREAVEEASVPADARYLPLDSRCTVPVVGVTGEFTWGPGVLVIPEYAFAVELTGAELALSGEHTDWRWAGYEAALGLLKWDSNRNALWELEQRLARPV